MLSEASRELTYTMASTRVSTRGGMKWGLRLTSANDEVHSEVGGRAGRGGVLRAPISPIVSVDL
jgi:hypothetical protein